ncbi:MAG: hypothetical protein ACQETH_00465 [Candidatus Rifleibacteriota bacterium]
MEKKIREILNKDRQNPEDFEKLLEKMADGSSEFEYLLVRFRKEKKKILHHSWQSWFNMLGWWFAKILMYSSLCLSISAVYLFGKAAVDPLTFGLIGAAFFYVIIQIFTPGHVVRYMKFQQESSGKSSFAENEQNNEKKAD